MSDDAYIRNFERKQALDKAYPLIPNTDAFLTQDFTGVARTADDGIVILSGSATPSDPITNGTVLLTLPSEVGIVGKVSGQDPAIPIINLAFPYVPASLPPGVETVFSALGGILINNQIILQGDITIPADAIIYFQGIFYRGTSGIPAI